MNESGNGVVQTSAHRPLLSACGTEGLYKVAQTSPAPQPLLLVCSTEGLYKAAIKSCPLGYGKSKRTHTDFGQQDFVALKRPKNQPIPHNIHGPISDPFVDTVSFSDILARPKTALKHLDNTPKPLHVETIKRAQTGKKKAPVSFILLVECQPHRQENWRVSSTSCREYRTFRDHPLPQTSF
jgi:hypothetical protein